MRWLDILLGRTRPAASRIENIFAISTAQVTLSVKFGANSTGKAGVALKPLTASYFDEAEQELQRILGITKKEAGTDFTITQDDYGYLWVILNDRNFEDLVASVHIVSLTLQENAFDDRLLAAAFQFADREQRRLHWIYNFKRGRYYPFVPVAGKKRDNALELRLRAVMEKELPIEPVLERWYPLWNIPVMTPPG